MRTSTLTSTAAAGAAAAFVCFAATLGHAAPTEAPEAAPVTSGSAVAGDTWTAPPQGSASAVAPDAERGAPPPDNTRRAKVGNTECSLRPRASVPAESQQSAVELVCDDLDERGLSGRFRVGLRRLGDGFSLTVTGPRGERHRMALASLDELESASARLAAQFAVPAAAATPSSVPPSAEKSPSVSVPKRPPARPLNVEFGLARTTDLSQSNLSAGLGGALSLYYRHARTHEFGVDLFGTGADRLGAGILVADVGYRHVLEFKHFAVFGGGAVGLSQSRHLQYCWDYYATASGYAPSCDRSPQTTFGFNLTATAGVELFRDNWLGVLAYGRLDVPTNRGSGYGESSAPLSVVVALRVF